jgi:hypothetical protein
VLRLLGLAVVLLLISAPSAMGQAAVDQYLPSAQPGIHHGSPTNEIAQAAEPSARPPKAKANKQVAAVSKGSTGGWPGAAGLLTPFVLIVILLFLAGVAARYLPRLIRRLRPAHNS